MSSDHTADQPTPAGSAIPRDVIIETLAVNVYRPGLNQPSIPALQRIAEPLADAILVALTEAGFMIVPADGFNAWYSPADIERLYRAVQDVAERTGKPFAGFQDAMDKALIAAASEPAGGEGSR